MENRSLKKRDVKVFPVWLGGRLWDASDLWACHLPNHLFLGYEYPFMGTRRDARKCRTVLKHANELINKHALAGNAPMAVFLITTWSVMEFAQKEKLNLKYKPSRRPLMTSLIPNSRRVFNYLIIMDGGKYYADDETGPYTENDKMAHQLGGVFLGYNTDAPTAGGRRLTAFLRRIMGYDLETDLFPNYDFETLKKMAWHIKRENFNFGTPREGAITKYAFDQNGRPIFDPCLD